MNARQRQSGESIQAWLVRRVREILDGDGVNFTFDSPNKSGHILSFEVGTTPAGTLRMKHKTFIVSVGRIASERFPEDLMGIAGNAILQVQKLGIETITIKMDSLLTNDEGQFLMMGLQTALLRADEFKTNGASNGLKTVHMPYAQSKVFVRALELARTSNVARWLTMLPPNILGVETFHRLLQDLFGHQSSVTLLGQDGEPTQDEYDRMGLLNAVAQGNGGERRVFAIRMTPLPGKGGLPRQDRAVAYVGKGLVYDTGGYSLKPSTTMRSMKADMGGAAGLVGAALYLMRPDQIEQLSQPVVFVWTITKNMVGPTAYVPDDVVTGFSGRTVEIDNTDAEGRLALADAMAWIPTVTLVRQVVAVCTLTGAAVTALGTSTALHLKNSRRRLDEVRRLEQCSFEVGDPVNVLHHRPQAGRILSSSTADIANGAGNNRDAGSQQGFAFLLAHVPDTVDTMELDIAGAVGNFTPCDGIQTGTARPAGTWFIIRHALGI